MTSNLGSRQLKDFGTGVGFGTSARTQRKSDIENSVIQGALKKAFAPEFLNRIDDVVLFNSLSREDIHSIIDIELRSLFGRIQDLGYHINLSDEAKDFVADEGFDEAFGARPLARALQKLIEDPLAEKIISKEITEGDTIHIGLDDKTLVFKVDKAPQVEAKDAVEELPEASTDEESTVKEESKDLKE
jgi:ATP-dependent Clp protease ATP-binding subunit ClpC